MGTPRADYETLASLLGSMVGSSTELRTFLRAAYPEVLPLLPSEDTPLAQLLHDAVRVLDRRGLVEDRFFSALRTLWPNRINDINAISSSWRSGNEPPRLRVDSAPSEKSERSIRPATSQPTTLTSRRRCGLLIPTLAVPAPHWEAVRRMISDSLPEWSVSPISATGDGAIQTEIIERLYNDPLIVADLSTANPNVMFELGMRMAFDKPVVIIRDNKTRPFFGLASIQQLEYPRDLNPSGLGSFKQRLIELADASIKSTNRTFIKMYAGPASGATAPPAESARIENLLSSRTSFHSTSAPPAGSQSSPKQQITLLLASASPDSESRLRVDREFGDIVESIDQGVDRFRLIQIQAASFERLRNALIKHQPDVLHISCHSDESGTLILEGRRGNREEVSKRQFLQLLRVVPGRLKLVFVNAAYSAEVAKDIPPTVEMAIGLTDTISDGDAQRFASTFYGSLAQGQSIEQSFSLGIAQLPDGSDHIPRLFSD